MEPKTKRPISLCLHIILYIMGLITIMEGLIKQDQILLLIVQMRKYAGFCVCRRSYSLPRMFSRHRRTAISNDRRLRKSWHGPDGKIQENYVFHILLSQGPEYIFWDYFSRFFVNKQKSVLASSTDARMTSGPWFTSMVNKGSSTNEISPIEKNSGPIENRGQVFLITCKSDFSSLNYRAKLVIHLYYIRHLFTRRQITDR